MQDNKLVINSLYYCECPRPGGRITVFTSNAYAVAEYEEETGHTKWQRVVVAPIRADIEKWLGQRFPKITTKAKSELLVK